MHWINAVAMFVMIGSGWKIYNDDVIFGVLHFPDILTIGKWAQHGLQWHFFGMWIFVLNGLAYLIYGIATGRFRRKLFPISIREIFVTVGDALRFRLGHDDLTHYNAVQKILYLGVMSDRNLHRHFRSGAVEAGAVLRAGGVVRQFPDHPAGAFPVHVRDRRVFACPCGVGAFGAAKPRRDAHRRAGGGRRRRRALPVPADGGEATQ